MTRRTLALLLTVTTLLLSLAGCAKESATDTSEVHSQTADTTAANDTTADTAPSSDPTEKTVNLSEILDTIPEVDDISMLEFPGIKWGATPADVKSALDLNDSQILVDETTGAGYKLWISEASIFGKNVFCGMFAFQQDPRTEEYALVSIQLYYPDETDMTVVRDVLTEIYGASTAEQGFTRYRISSGKVNSYVDTGFKTIYPQGEYEPVMAWWESAAKRADALPADVQEAMFESGMLSPVGERLDPSDPSTREIALEYLEKDPAVLLYCTDSSRAGMGANPYYTKNVVYFDAAEYMVQLLHFVK